MSARSRAIKRAQAGLTVAQALAPKVPTYSRLHRADVAEATAADRRRGEHPYEHIAVESIAVQEASKVDREPGKVGHIPGPLPAVAAPKRDAITEADREYARRVMAR